MNDPLKIQRSEHLKEMFKESAISMKMNIFRKCDKTTILAEIKRTHIAKGFSPCEVNELICCYRAIGEGITDNDKKLIYGILKKIKKSADGRRRTCHLENVLTLHEIMRSKSENDFFKKVDSELIEKHYKRIKVESLIKFIREVPEVYKRKSDDLINFKNIHKLFDHLGKYVEKSKSKEYTEVGPRLERLIDLISTDNSLDSVEKESIEIIEDLQRIWEIPHEGLGQQMTVIKK